MAETQTLHDAFLDELKDAYDAEKQELLLRFLPPLTVMVKKRLADLTRQITSSPEGLRYDDRALKAEC